MHMESFFLQCLSNLRELPLPTQGDCYVLASKTFSVGFSSSFFCTCPGLPVQVSASYKYRPPTFAENIATLFPCMGRVGHVHGATVPNSRLRYSSLLAL